MSTTDLKNYVIRVLRGTECYCGAHKKPFASLCLHCYFELSDELRDRMLPVMAIGLFARAGMEFPNLHPIFWEKYPRWIRDCLNYLDQHSNRINPGNKAMAGERGVVE